MPTFRDLPSRATALVLLAMLSSSLHAAVTLDGLSLGSSVSGPTVGAGDLKGRVVLFEYWGINCGPCLASIPHLAELQAKLGRDNFIVIANQCQEADDATARSTWMSHGGGALATLVNHHELPGAQVTGIPHCFLFDNEGKLIFDGNPASLGTKPEDAVKASPGALVTGHQYTKTAKYAAQIGALTSNLAPTLKALRVVAAGQDATVKEEADFLLGRVSEYADNRLAAVQAERTEHPLEAGKILARMLAILKGDPLGKPFEDLFTELKADKTFQTELKAGAFLAEIEAQASKLGVGNQPGPPKSALVDLVARIKALEQRFPDTLAGKKALQLAEEWKL